MLEVARRLRGRGRYQETEQLQLSLTTCASCKASFSLSHLFSFPFVPLNTISPPAPASQLSPGQNDGMKAVSVPLRTVLHVA